MVFKKIMALLMALLMVGVVFAACTTDDPSDGTGTGTGSDSVSVSDSDTESDDEDIVYTDNVPKDLRFDGESLTFTTVSWYDYEIFVEEPEQEATSQAVYNRNLAMEERFGVTIDSIPIANDTHAEHPQYIREIIMAGDQTFDIAATFVYTAGSLILEDLFLDWTTVPYVDLDQPYWVKNINDEFTVDGKLYSAVSDTCITSMQLTYGYLFNQQIAEDEKIEDLYSVVEDDRWTLDYMYELTRDLYRDVDGGGQRDMHDRFGLITDLNTSVDAYMATSNQTLLKATDTGLEVRLDGDRALGIFEKLKKLLIESDGTYYYWHNNNGANYADKYPLFMANGALLMPVRLSALYDQLRDMDADYGILPYPKYDEAQDEYYSSCLDNYSVLCIPKDVANLNLVGALSEAMACESKNTVMPAFYETALQDKYTRDDKAKDMLDIIMDGRTFDLCVLYSYDTNSLKAFITSTLRDGGDFASAYAAKKEGFELAAQTLYSKLRELGAE